jgi:hypothetical protein
MESPADRTQRVFQLQITQIVGSLDELDSSGVCGPRELQHVPWISSDTNGAAAHVLPIAAVRRHAVEFKEEGGGEESRSDLGQLLHVGAAFGVVHQGFHTSDVV